MIEFTSDAHITVRAYFASGKRHETDGLTVDTARDLVKQSIAKFRTLTKVEVSGLTKDDAYAVYTWERGNGWSSAKYAD